jgi:hypothetical protein
MTAAFMRITILEPDLPAEHLANAAGKAKYSTL